MRATRINSYVSEKHWPPKPEWHRSWIEQRKYRFQRGVLDEVAVLARAVVQAPSFRGKRYEEPRCIYATNAVKVYVPEKRGKRAANLRKQDSSLTSGSGVVSPDRDRRQHGRVRALAKAP